MDAHAGESAAARRADVAVREGAVLVHVGPPKTATSQLQAALYAARPALASRGVRHAGRGRHPAGAIQAVLGRKSAFAGGTVPSIGRWNDLAREIRDAREPRVVVSSEFLADARPEAIRRIVADLAPREVHVLVTLRPLARILPSQWQQHICDGGVIAFDAWLHAMLEGSETKVTPGFWRRHRHHELVRRWADVVGAERVTVIALPDDDPDAVLAHAAGLLGVGAGVLQGQPAVANRSLTLPEAEAVRAFNAAFRDAGLPEAELAGVMHFGASRYLKALPRDPAAPRIELPAWSLPLVGEAAAQIVAGIRASGVAVLGELDGLAAVPATGSAEPAPAPVVSADVAGALAMGVLIATGGARPGTADDPALAHLPPHALAGVIARRAVRRLTGGR